MAEGRVRALCLKPTTAAEEPSSALSGTFSHFFATGEGEAMESDIIRRRTSYAIALLLKARDDEAADIGVVVDDQHRYRREWDIVAGWLV